jgi:hypothetical protein
MALELFLIVIILEVIIQMVSKIGFLILLLGELEWEGKMGTGLVLIGLVGVFPLVVKMLVDLLQRLDKHIQHHDMHEHFQ